MSLLNLRELDRLDLAALDTIPVTVVDVRRTCADPDCRIAAIREAGRLHLPAVEDAPLCSICGLSPRTHGMECETCWRFSVESDKAVSRADH